MSKLTDKAKAFHSEPITGAPRTADPQRPRTGVGAFTASLAAGRKIEERNRDLEKRLSELQGAGVVRQLDPARVRGSRYANRIEQSSGTAEFQSFKDEIAASGGNVEAIKVRPVGGHEDEFEIVYGHRRHRACLELGIQVAAIVEDMSDAELFEQMDRENRGGQNLSAWEQGLMYKRALDEGLFPSLKALAEALGCNIGNASTAISLASLPREVIDAFSSPLELQFRWARPLKDAVETNGKRVFAVAREIARSSPRPAAVVVYRRLTDCASDGAGKHSKVYEVRGKKAGVFERDTRGNIVLRIKAGHFGEDDEKSLRQAIEQIFAKINAGDV
jgi:ParB family chromosome partitioning protein